MLEKDMDQTKELGRNVRKLREKIGLSQDFVAQEIGLNRHSIMGIEAGTRAMNAYELFKLADLFSVSADELLNPKTPAAPFLDFQTAVMHLRSNDSISDQGKKDLLEFKSICEDYNFLKSLRHER